MVRGRIGIDRKGIEKRLIHGLMSNSEYPD